MKGRIFIAAMLLALAMMPAGPARADGNGDDPDFLTLGAGRFDFFRSRVPAGEIRLDYRFHNKWWIFKPFLTGAYVTNNSTFIGAGVLIDVYLGRRLVLTPQFSPIWWRGKSDKLDLGYPLEFRSRMELSYRFDDRSRLGISIDHTSNAGLGDGNPGVESIMLNYSMPISRITSLFGK